MTARARAEEKARAALACSCKITIACGICGHSPTVDVTEALLAARREALEEAAQVAAPDPDAHAGQSCGYTCPCERIDGREEAVAAIRTLAAKDAAS